MFDGGERRVKHDQTFSPKSLAGWHYLRWEGLLGGTGFVSSGVQIQTH